ncbi:hypothetical protein BJY52DRAFT_1418621 [Lactarius psammicola]|nr:hypothetical protein BJY52DRAFT_1418621 [Lactarius psammicola]
MCAETKVLMAEVIEGAECLDSFMDRWGKRVSSGVGQGMNEARECAACPSLSALRAICDAVGVGSLRRGCVRAIMSDEVCEREKEGRMGELEARSMEIAVSATSREIKEGWRRVKARAWGGHTQAEAIWIVKRKPNWVMASGGPEERRAGTDGKRCERRDQVRVSETYDNSEMKLKGLMQPSRVSELGREKR